jgi:hypothetical protein
MKPIYLACAAVLFPHAAAGQSTAFAVESEVTVRADSFACKETSELDCLLQRNRTGAFTSGTQLYDYLKAHKCIGLSAGRARVYANRGQYVCIYDPKDNRPPSIRAPGHEEICCRNDECLDIPKRQRRPRSTSSRRRRRTYSAALSRDTCAAEELVSRRQMLNAKNSAYQISRDIGIRRANDQQPSPLRLALGLRFALLASLRQSRSLQASCHLSMRL